MKDKSYGCSKHRLTFEEFWDKTQELEDMDDFCPVCVKEKIHQSFWQELLGIPRQRKLPELKEDVLLRL